MASDPRFVDYLCEQARAAAPVARKMFGEYAIYSQGKVVALVCDNQLFVKPTDAGRALLGPVVEAAPYPGARPHWLVTDLIDDGEQLGCLLHVTAEALPAPKPKRANAIDESQAAAAPARRMIRAP